MKRNILPELQAALKLLSELGLTVSTTDDSGVQVTYNNSTGGKCPLSISLRSFRIHKGWSQSELCRRMRSEAEVENSWGQEGYCSLTATSISQLESGKKSFDSRTKYHGSYDMYTIAEALDNVFGKEWRKEASPVRAHNRVLSLVQ